MASSRWNSCTVALSAWKLNKLFRSRRKFIGEPPAGRRATSLSSSFERSGCIRPPPRATLLILSQRELRKSRGAGGPAARRVAVIRTTGAGVYLSDDGGRQEGRRLPRTRVREIGRASCRERV